VNDPPSNGGGSRTRHLTAAPHRPNVTVLVVRRLFTHVHIHPPWARSSSGRIAICFPFVIWHFPSPPLPRKEVSPREAECPGIPVARSLRECRESAMTLIAEPWGQVSQPDHVGLVGVSPNSNTVQWVALNWCKLWLKHTRSPRWAVLR